MGEIMWCCKCREKKDTTNNIVEFFDTNRGRKKGIRGKCKDCETNTIIFVKMD